MSVLRARILFFMMSVSPYLGAALEIFRPPNDTTVFLDSIAVFMCEVNGGLASWRVNGTFYNSLSAEIRSDLDTDQEAGAGGNEILTVTVPGRAEYNGTRVQCYTIIPGSASVESRTVIMTVQGILSSVADLKASSNATSVTISWTAPFSLDVTGVDPDIWYSVIIYNVTDEPTVVPCTDCVNITETHYTFTPHYPSPCQEYVFSVTPLNGAGQGVTSHNVTGYTISNLYPTIMVGLPVITAVDSYFYRVAFILLGDVCTYSLTGIDSNFINLDRGSDPEAVVLILSSNRYYTTSVEVSNVATTTTSGVIFSTFDVQVFIAETNGSEIVMTGVFAADSAAKGLLVVLQSDNNSSDLFLAVMRDGQEETLSSSVVVPPSTYTVFVYDLEEDALPNECVAFSQTKTLTVTAESVGQRLDNNSEFLAGATIYLTGSEVYVTCEFYKDHLESSCVLVYREHGNTTLVVKEYGTNDEFPAIITINRTASSYTFAVFGKNGNERIDLMPVLVYQYVVTTTDHDKPAPSLLPSKSSSSTSFGEGVAVGMAVGVTSSAIVVVTAVIIIKCKSAKYHRKVVLTRNAAYEVNSPNRDRMGDQRNVSLKRNIAYEVRKPRNAPTGTPLYEECN